MEGSKDFKWHLTAIVVVGIWGMTFISTRVLIENGLTPQGFALFSDGEYRPRSDAYHKCGFYCL